MRGLLILLMMPFAAWSQDAELHAPLPSDRLVVLAYYPSQEALQELSNEFAPWSINQREGSVTLDLNEDEMERLRQAGFYLEIDFETTAKLHQPLAFLPGQSAGIPGFPCYPTVAETYATAEQWETDHPTLARWVDVGDSWDKTIDPNAGHDMRVLVLANQQTPGPKPAIFIMSSVHAREYTPAGVNFNLARFLLENYDTDPDVTWLLDHHEIHLMLLANPDGRVHAQTGLFWRKNVNNNYCTGSEDRGADLNRNFAFMWGCCNGSSNNECAQTYRGPSAASEPEIQTIQDYVRALFPDQREDDITLPAPPDATGIFVDVHSSGELVLWPYGFTSTLVPNQEGHRALGRKLAWFNDYTPEPISQFTIADGSTVDFSYGELGVASFAYELGTSFFQDCGVFENQVLPDNLAGLLYLARHARAPYLSAGGPDTVSLVADTQTAPGFLQVSASLDDTRYNNTNGVEVTHDIVAAEFFVDTPPWEAGAVAHPMTAQDGDFNSPVEAVTGSFDLAGLSAGRHLLFVRGGDVSGKTGVVTTAFFQVTLRYEDMLALWPNGITVLDLLEAL